MFVALEAERLCKFVSLVMFVPGEHYISGALRAQSSSAYSSSTDDTPCLDTPWKNIFSFGIFVLSSLMHASIYGCTSIVPGAHSAQVSIYRSSSRTDGVICTRVIIMLRKGTMTPKSSKHDSTVYLVYNDRGPAKFVKIFLV